MSNNTILDNDNKLTVSEQFEKVITEPVDNQGMPDIECPRCGQVKTADRRNPHICVDCAKAENSLYTHRRMHNDWTTVAQESGIELWQQQPEETQWEYTVWLAYRDSYPGKKPSYRAVAEQLGTTVNAVMKIASRWSFQMRMQAWMRYCDEVTLLQRRTEILDMNKSHIDMATSLRNKLASAIDMIEPVALKPSDIASLMRISADLERKARIDTIAQEELVHDLTSDNDNPNLKKAPTKQSDLSEVVQILMKSGALGQIAGIGIKETKTTEIALVDTKKNAASIQLDKGD